MTKTKKVFLETQINLEKLKMLIFLVPKSDNLSNH